MDWISRVFIFALLLYLAYQWGRLPRRLDQYVRSLAVEYKRWADQDSLHEEVIRKEREKSSTSRRRIRRIEMNREDDANSFRRIDEKTAELIEKRNQEELARLDQSEEERET